MINTVDFKPNEEYFAAANSYFGFVNNFTREFDPVRYEHIFILKGGPGTGKSTLMRGIGSHFSGKEYIIKAIYCSSDVHSLDGVVITNQEKSVCIIDGTAPHSTDPIYPGVKEEIIDLGRGFNVSALKANDSKIISLNQAKKKHYKSAYDLLKIAGSINDKIWDNYQKTYDYSRAEFIIEELLSERKFEKSECIDWRFISCFNKDGILRIPMQKSSNHTIKICGNGYSEYLFMNHLLYHIKQENINAIYRSPKSEKMIECIKTQDITLLVDKSNEALDTISLSEPTGESVRLTEYKAGVEALAAESFAMASGAHFELEKIYKGAVDFSHNEEVFSELVEKVTLYLK